MAGVTPPSVWAPGRPGGRGPVGPCTVQLPMLGIDRTDLEFAVMRIRPDLAGRELPTVAQVLMALGISEHDVEAMPYAERLRRIASAVDRLEPREWLW